MSAAAASLREPDSLREPGSLRDWWAGVGIFCVAVALRGLYVAHVWSVPAARYRMVDSRAYHERALAILAGDWLGDGVFYQAPLYPYFLAGVYRWLDPEGPGALYVQALLGALTAVLVYAIARRVFDFPTAVAAGLLAATYKLFPYYDAQLLKVSLSVFLITGALALVVWAVSARHTVLWLAAGMALGLASLTRGNYLLFAPLLAGLVAVSGRRAPRRAAAAVALLGVGLLAVLGPVALRNRWVGGEWVLVTAQAGQNFYIGNQRSNDSGSYRAPPFVTPNPRQEQAGFRDEARRRTGRALGAAATSRYWARQGLAEIAADPEHFRRHTLRKLVLFANDWEVPDNQSFAFFRRSVTPVLGLPLPSFGWLLPPALLGMALAWRRRPAQPLLLFFAGYAASVVLTFNFSRYRMPVVPVVIVFAAAAGMALVRDGPRWPAPRLAAALLLLAAGYAVAFWPVGRESFASHHFNLAVHLREHAQRADTRPAERSALLADAYRELGRALDAGPPGPHLARRLPEVAGRWVRDAWRDGADARALALAAALARAFPDDAQAAELLAACRRRAGDGRAPPPAATP